MEVRDIRMYEIYLHVQFVFLKFLARYIFEITEYGLGHRKNVWYTTQSVTTYVKFH